MPGIKDLLGTIFGGESPIKTVGDIIDDSIYSKAEKVADANLALEKAQEFQLRREELEQAEFDKVLANHLEYYKTDALDRASARQTEVQVLNAPNVSWINANIRPLLAISTLIIAFTFLFLLVFKRSAISAIDSVLLGTILGAVLGYVTVILSYYFGSTSSSEDKNKTIQNLTK